MATPQLPKFSTVIKARDVEDPVNLWVHRPLAYGFVALVYRTAMTPNQITVLASLVGLVSAACWFEGSPRMMLLGGILLWSAAILDGADGILARAKQMTSEFGRALDGAMDMVVAIATCFAAFYHIWIRNPEPLYAVLMAVAAVTATCQIWLYDHYKEAYQQSINPAWNGQPEALEDAEARLKRYQDEGAGWFQIWVARLYVGVISSQHRLVRLTNPGDLRDGLRFPVSDETTRVHRRFNYGPMQLWTLVSLAPHSYLMAIAGMFDRLDVYLWFRVVGANAICLVALIWQRLATQRTLRELERLGAAPVPASRG